MNTFKLLYGNYNPSYGETTKWFRRNKNKYHIIELFNLNYIDKNSLHKYNVSLSVIDLDVIPEDIMLTAIKYCGLEGQVLDDLMKVEALHCSGYKAPIIDIDGNNYKKLMQIARKESKFIDDEHNYDIAMDKPVNNIGTPAIEFMKGNIL